MWYGEAGTRQETDATGHKHEGGQTGVDRCQEVQVLQGGTCASGYRQGGVDKRGGKWHGEMYQRVLQGG